jgi:hypothetical protein
VTAAGAAFCCWSSTVLDVGRNVLSVMLASFKGKKQTPAGSSRLTDCLTLSEPHNFGQGSRAANVLNNFCDMYITADTVSFET